MNKPLAPAIAWVHEGVWGILSRWFKVPQEPPNLPAAPGDHVTTFRPSDEWLRYLKLNFWVSYVAANVAQLAAWITIGVAFPLALIFLLPVAGVLVAFPLAFGYVAMYLRYETTWYLLSTRSMRIRRGIWTVHETTITYENVQNVVVHQGPLQRMFGIADVIVKTAGGGGHATPHQAAAFSSHVGLLEGLANAQEVREMILNRVRQSQNAGLGDEAHTTHAPQVAVAAPCVAIESPEQVAVLREIRDALKSLVAQPISA